MGKYTTIQIKRELYKELHDYCCEHGYSNSRFIERLIKQRIEQPQNVLRVGK